ncbi:hypothetical protein PENTCL1PPCAC_7074 [Pristionchus entomophagus]|uniref:C2H2-type domain-containing protein n=1 Tax=Pristionchus entomophagus TaxID=358040 RepID=A0AAV5SU49_9BILA|nr:hypothetical protein PENTCL1PPCAC_7074 [Pristionchus entomophagus]
MLEKHMARHEMKKETMKSNVSVREDSSLTEEITSLSNSPIVLERMEEDTESATSTEDNESEKQETSSETDNEVTCAECNYR